MKPKGIEICPVTLLGPFDAIEVHPVRVVDENPKGSYAIEQCDEKDADFYTVYVHYVDGGLDAIIDCEKEQDAYAMKELLEQLVKNYKHEKD